MRLLQSCNVKLPLSSRLRKFFTHRYLVTSLMALAILALPLPAQVGLSWKLPAGASFTIERVYEQKQSVTSKGKEFKSALSTTWVAKFTVPRFPRRGQNWSRVSCP